MNWNRFTSTVLVCVVAVAAVAAVAQTKRSAGRDQGFLAYTSQVNWLTDAHEDVSVLRDRAATALRQMNFDVEARGDGGLAATRRDPSFSGTPLASGSSLTITCEVKRVPGVERIIHRVSFAAEAQYRPHIGKHPYAGVNTARERLELAQSRVARAISLKPEAEIELVDADSLRPHIGVCITLKGRALNQKDGVFIAAEGVEVEIPSEAREQFKGVPEQDMEWTGVLRLVHESHWYKDPNEHLKPGEGVYQSRASHQTPVRFRLEP
ncbi:MAG: hypothetical protein KF869_05560 [Phycisphaeraceae bacterium]|nr:hypothetical protein [Phycisphaeraceae bacterium]